jgi:arylsulfatase
MGFSDIGCFGSDVPTPNLDKLASRGVKLNQFYNNPRCCPSRASIMTGLYSHQAGMGMMTKDYKRYPFPQYAGTLSAHTATIPEVLRQSGYRTAAAGKWHLSALGEGVGKENWPLQRGFEKYWGFLDGSSTYFNPAALTEDNTPLPPVHDPEFYMTDKIGDHAVGFVDEFAKGKDPFFLYCAFNAAHWPIQAPEKLIQKYATRYADGWDKLREKRHAKQIAEGIVQPEWPLSTRDARVPAWENAKDKEWEIRRMAVYAAMIDSLDQNIGRLVDAVERNGIAENTLIIFLADNGGNAEEIKVLPVDAATGIRQGNDPKIMPGDATTFQSIGIPWGNCANTPFRLYKHYAHEGGISTPFVACWPKVISPVKHPVNALGHETDLMPTFLEAAGAVYPEKNAAGPLPALVGESLIPVFTGKQRTRGPIFWEHEGNKAVRDGKWKLVSRFPVGWELHDMEADRTEMHDLAAEQPERVKKMEAMYEAWAAKIGVQPWPMPQTPQGSTRTGALVTPPYLGGADD